MLSSWKEIIKTPTEGDVEQAWNESKCRYDNHIFGEMFSKHSERIAPYCYTATIYALLHTSIAISVLIATQFLIMNQPFRCLNMALKN
jgi:hypothetical protein